MKSYKSLNDAMDDMTSSIKSYTPEDLSWKLLTDNELTSATAEILTADSEGGNQNTYLFEILLTMYIEMLINNAKLFHLINKSESGSIITLDDFRLNFDGLTIDQLTDPFREKLLKIKYFLRIETVTNLDKFCYCKILFRDLPSNDVFFQGHANITKKYHFILCSTFKQTPYMKLEDIYAIAYINGTNYRVNFEKVIVHEDNEPEKILL